MKNVIAYLCISLAIVITIIMMVVKTEDPEQGMLDLDNQASTEIENKVDEDQNEETIIIELEEINETIVENEEPILFEISLIPDDIFQLMDQVSYQKNDIIQREDLRLLDLTYVDFNHEIQYGQMIVHKEVAEEVLEIFEILFNNQYNIDKIRLVHYYKADDNLSMADNNTHAFNFRYITGGSSLSNHAYGLAVDINPMQNPYIYGNLVLPEGSEAYIDRNIYQMGMIQKNDILYQAFTSRGWSWGGDWNSLKDYQHFEKKINGLND